MTLFLDHLYLLDLSRGVAGSYCTKLMADAGARVVRIESAADPDPLRPLPGDGDIERAALFAHLNTSKQSAAIDVTGEPGRRQLLSLVALADAVIEDRPPDRLDALGLGFEALRAANPSIVLTSITPFGQTGPYRDYRADELLVYAMGARMSSTGIAPRPPVRLAPESSSYFAGAAAAGATLTALWQAAVDGAGDHLDVSMVECLLGAPDRQILAWEYGRVDEPRIDAPRPLQDFPCSDGHIAIGMARGLERVAHAIGRADLLDDERFATRMARLQHFAELEAIISAWTVQHTRREAFEHLQRFRVIAAPLNTVPDLANDPQFAHRRAFLDLDAGGVRYRVPGRPFREAGAEPTPLAPPPALGAQTSQLLAEIGSSEPPPAERRPASGALPLAGLRVIDFGEAYAGPYCCTMLADAGAEVIRVENVHRQPANLRGLPVPLPPFLGYRDHDPGERPWNRFFLHNGFERNKRGITLDLKQERGRALFLQLVRESDVMVCNFARKAVQSLAVDYEDLKAVNPDLVMVFISGYGIDGPYRDHAALGSTIDAITAHQSLRGYPESAPLENQHSYFSDSITAYTACFATMAALHRRRRTGRGAHLDMALTESLFPVIGGQIATAAAAGEPPTVYGNRDPVAAPHGCYRSRPLPDDPQTQRLTADRWIAISCPDEAAWAALASLMDRPDIASDPRFATLDARRAHQDELDDVIGEWTSRHDATALMHRLQAAGVPAMAVMPDSDVFEDPHLAARGYFAAVEHRDAGRYRVPGPLWRSSRHDIRVRTPAHCLGEHNRDVLQGLLGVDDEEFETLERDEVIGEAYASDMRPASR